MPCRGSGKVISNLGGSLSTVDCPWCQGGGVRLAGIDAQAHWGDGDGEPGASADGDSAAAQAPAAD